MRYIKGCPKCGGNMFPEQHLGGEVDYSCLQCGRRLTPEEAALLTQRIAAMQARRAA